jgi:DNA-binding protein H-NS
VKYSLVELVLPSRQSEMDVGHGLDLQGEARLRDALNAGRSIDEFRVGATPAESAPLAAETKKPTSKTTVKTSRRAPSKVNYSDGAGNSWTGRGPRPR